MAPKNRIQPASKDAFSLVFASISELVSAIESEDTLADEGAGVPPRANQIGRLIAAEAVRLIRLGTRAELTAAADELAQLLVRPAGDELERRHPDAHRLVSGAAITLNSAAAPSSSGGELAVLRSWNGKAKEVVARVNRSRRRAVPRADLLRSIDFGEAPESSLSHLLADLEAAGLIVRIRDGRNVTVHLGPTGRSEHVQEALLAHEAVVEGESYLERRELAHGWLQPRIDQALAHGIAEDDAEEIEGARELLREVMERRPPGQATATVEDFPPADHVPYRVKLGDEVVVGTARVQGGTVVEVTTYRPTGPERPGPSRRPRHARLHEEMLRRYAGRGDSRVSEPSAREAFDNIDESHAASREPSWHGVGDMLVAAGTD